MEPTYRDRAVVLGDTLVLSDLHVGKGASNLELPVGGATDVVERFEALAERYEPEAVVFGGDLLHSFSTVPRSVRRTVDALAEACREAGARAVVTPGNHDTMLDAAWDGPTEREHRVGDAVVLHGHEPPEAEADLYVVGHDHPTVEIEGQRRACYLYAEDAYEGADVLMLPAFNRLLAGVDVGGMSAADFQSPLVTDADQFRPIVYDEGSEEPLEFPPLGEFRRML
ncbi:metallophosphoesterase [Halomicrobium salinisoli]|uniref:metallophosphoesterase n=1 Tax=Halomicrobium salinisoli TaxID=2878391 RepID=UPI001CEFD399|nr:metallophosphoesterase [Halomicrobium salinisoli]